MAKKLIPLLILASAALPACGKDRTLDQYNLDKTQQELGKLRDAEGLYRGVVYSLTDNEPMGILEVSFTAQTKVAAGGRATRADEQPVLTTRAQLTTDRRMELVYDDSFYNVENKNYKATIPVQMRGTQGTVTIALDGILANGEFSGTVYALDFPEKGGKFVTRRNGEIPAEIRNRLGRAKESSPSDGVIQNPTETLNGYTQFNNKVKKPVSLVIVQPELTTEEEFVSVFSPVRPVQVALNYGNSIAITHANARIDRRSGTLVGSASTDRGEITTNCTREIRNNVDGWICRHYTRALGQMATTYVQKNGQPPALDDGGDRLTRKVVLKGTSRLEGRWQDSYAEMIVTYAARSRSEEILELYFPVTKRAVQATLTYNEQVHRVFSSVVYEQDLQTLDGSATYSGYGETLQCNHFDLFNPAEDREVTCSIINSRLMYPIEFQLKPVAMNVK